MAAASRRTECDGFGACDGPVGGAILLGVKGDEVSDTSGEYGAANCLLRFSSRDDFASSSKASLVAAALTLSKASSDAFDCSAGFAVTAALDWPIDGPDLTPVVT